MVRVQGFVGVPQIVILPGDAILIALKVTLVMAVQSVKAPEAMDVAFSPIVTDVMLVQPLKTFDVISVTFVKSTEHVILTQPLNAYCPIVVTLDGNPVKSALV